MDSDQIRDILDSDTARRLLSGEVPARVAYVGTDGRPRVVPIAFLWTGEQVVLCTSTNAPKVKALGSNPDVALTIDTTDMPPQILLLRGTAELETVDGIPDEYLQLRRPRVPDAMWDEWLAEVTALYDEMVRITITPTWAKVIDFVDTLPQAVEELAQKRAAAG